MESSFESKEKNVVFYNSPSWRFVITPSVTHMARLRVNSFFYDAILCVGFMCRVKPRLFYLHRKIDPFFKMEINILAKNRDVKYNLF